MTIIKMETNNNVNDYTVKVTVKSPVEDYYEDLLFVMGILTNEGKRKIVEVDFSMEYFVIDCYEEKLDEVLAKNHFTLGELLNYKDFYYQAWTYVYNE